MISVCMATHNGERYIREQIQSILSQLQADDEIIIVDDGSTDQTLGVLKAFTDGRIKIFPEASSRGPAHSFATAIQRSQGELIFLADQDDVWKAGKVKEVLLEASRMPAGDLLIAHEVEWVDSELRPLDPAPAPARPTGSPWALLWRSRYIGATMAFTRSLAEKATSETGRAPMHDWWLAVVAAFEGEIRFLPQPLILYRRHGATLTHPERAKPLLARMGRAFRFRVLMGMALLRWFLSRPVSKVEGIRS